MSGEATICAAVAYRRVEVRSEIYDGLTAICGLPTGHEGRHEAVVRVNTYAATYVKAWVIW